jgi:N-acetylglutamate synthase-like GNAT family acetyltransferase
MSAVAAVHPLQVRRCATTVRAAAVVTIRSGCASDVDAIHALIARYREAGQLLPRTRENIAAFIDRFIVATNGREVLGCADLAPLSTAVAEVRSLVVAEGARANGVGRRLLSGLLTRAGAAGFATVAALTHSPAFFVTRGFSIVPHQWLPEKIARDCQSCAQFRTCGQYAVVLPLSNG